MDVSDIFYFFCSGEGEGSPRHREGGGDWFFIKNPRRGGFSRKGKGPGGCLRQVGEFFGGGGG